MNHLTIIQIQELLFGSADDSTLTAIENHLNICSDCVEKVSAYRKVETALRGMPAERTSSGFTRRVMQELRIEEAPSFVWKFLKNLAPVVGLFLVTGIAMGALYFSGALKTPEVQNSLALSQSAYDTVSGGLKESVWTFNGWMQKLFPFAFAKNGYGLTMFLLFFFAALALLDKYLLMPLMRRR